jgi:hypothetical protein
MIQFIKEKEENLKKKMARKKEAQEVGKKRSHRLI